MYVRLRIQDLVESSSSTVPPLPIAGSADMHKRKLYSDSAADDHAGVQRTAVRSSFNGHVWDKTDLDRA